MIALNQKNKHLCEVFLEEKKISPERSMDTLMILSERGSIQFFRGYLQGLILPQGRT